MAREIEVLVATAEPNENGKVKELEKIKTQMHLNSKR